MNPTNLFILHLPPPVHGAAMMGKYIHDSKLINESFCCRYINLTTAKSLQDIGKGGIGKLWKFVCLFGKVIKAVISFKPRLVYVTPNACGRAFYKDFVIVQLLKLMRCKVVLHYHNKGVTTRQDRLLDDWFYRQFFKGVKVILLAEALYKDVEKYVDRKDVFICPNGIPESLTENPSVERHNRVPHLLFLSNLLESKGVLVLLDACKILKDKGYSFVCDFVGGETAEIDARRFAEEVEARGLNKLAIYQGRKYGEEKEIFWQNADIFVFPTYYHNECFPLVLLEAMQHGVACISTNEGGILDIIEDGKTGFIVEKQNPEQLAEKIEQFIINPRLAMLQGKSGKKRFEEQFTLEAFENNMKNVLQQVISQ